MRPTSARGKDREPRPDDDVSLARPDPAPLVGALAVTETGMDERDPRIEIRPQAVDERQCEGDLGNEDERRAAASRVAAMASM